MKVKKSLFSLLVVAAATLTGCGETTSVGGTSNKPTSETPSSETTTSTISLPSGDGETLAMSIQYQKEGTRMKYPAETASDKKVSYPYTHAGKTYNAGDWKPTWKTLQENLKFTINDVTDDSQTKIADAFKTWQTKQFKGVNIAQGSSSDIIAEGTKSGTILDLSKYLDIMPDFKAFLDENPAIRAFISDANGAIYYAPYFDGFNDIERMLMLRQDWVKTLLDGDANTLTGATPITKSYTAFYPEAETKEITVVKADGSGTEVVKKVKTANVITIQNDTNFSAKALVKALQDHIDATYKKADGTKYFTKRSDLFVGQNACYDVDELVALFRCVRAASVDLAGAGKVIVPLFPRAETNDRTADLWRFTQFFGVRGGESRNGYLYVNSQGEIVDARGTTEMKLALKKMNEMYKEGLIYQDFTTKWGSNSEFRKPLLTGKESALGFALYDYNQTSTILNDSCDALKGYGDNEAKFVSVLPAVAKWNGSDDYSFFTESWRSVKTEGWFITAETAKDEKKLSKALEVFNYFYSEEGNRLMSYGPDDYLAKNADGSIKTMDYQGKQVPVLSDETLNELATLASGNYTNYYRYWLGATLPSGYIKQQGMEYQTVCKGAKPALDRLNKAIELGVIKHVNFKLDNADKFYNIVPTTFSFNAGEATAIGDQFTALDAAINNTKGKTNIWSTIVMKGFDSGEGIPTYAGYEDYVNNTLKCKQYVNIHNNAYKRIIALVPGATKEN
ncbi:MAG: hypothetical protein PUB23_03615 [Bacilli bacterium]|nr:hypothetical protein [Bacilli bacterium]